MVGHIVQDFVNNKAAVRFYALMGAAGAVSGSIRMTLSVTVVLMELVSSSIMGAPIMLCALTAKLVGDALSPSFYDRVSRINDLPTLAQETPETFHEHTVYDVMTELDHGEHHLPVCLSVDESAEYAEEVLSKTEHNGFPVVVDRHQDMTLKVGKHVRSAQGNNASLSNMILNQTQGSALVRFQRNLDESPQELM